MMIHGHTRKRELVDILFHLGLSISYDRVLDISMDMAIAAAQQYESDEVVCPLILRKNLFTTAAVDNLDHNPSSELLMMLSMEQASHSFKIGLRSQTESCVPNQNYNQVFQGRRYQHSLNRTQI